VVDKEFSSWEEALDTIGQRMQQFRNRRPPDYQNVKNAVQGQPLMQSVKRAAFGLPIVFFFSSLYKQYIQQGMKKDQARTKATGTLEGSEHDRRASPLFIRVTRLANGKYVLVLTLFQAELLEAGEKLKLKLKRQGSPTYVNAPDLSLIDDFIQEIRRNIGPCLEVTGW
jgi:CRISPR-associated protein Cmr1